MKTKPWPWDVTLNAVIGEIVGEDGLRDHEVLDLKEPAAGLAAIFGSSPMTRRRACMRLAQRLNQEQINVAARNWLPPDWGSNVHHLHALSLMLWGLTEAHLSAPSYWQTTDEVAGLVACMLDWNPAFVMAVLTNPERPESADDEVFLDAQDVEQAEDAATAAAYMLESLEIAVIAGQLNG